MSTVLYDSPIFGPIHSRRMGTSLGVNLNPSGRKVCSFDCIYCECGFNVKTPLTSSAEHHIPSRVEVAEALELTLKKMQAEGKTLDVITFAGNGEPTLHVDFLNVIEDTINLRNQYFPKANIAVLTNGTRVHIPKVFEALCKVDKPCVKIDSLDMDIVKALDRPVDADYSVQRVVDTLAGHKMEHLVVQTMFCQWKAGEEWKNNYSSENVDKWVDTIRNLRPSAVQVYTISRETPYQDMQKAPAEVLNAIADRVRDIVGDVTVSM
ncbi:MAG: radical SAM protein [Bacteroidia bacterium]|nr:radical SAM protein [Bacteroidia bacterium]